jgi:hypothetical protein
MRYSIIDVLGPFINPNENPTNWSKVPFEFYENKPIPKINRENIIERFELFIIKIKKIGYNSISLDDLPHMICLDYYSESTKKIIKEYQILYKHLTVIAKKNNLHVFVNFDLMYFNNEIEKYTKFEDKYIIKTIKDSVNHLFSKYEIDGVITRIGECDGIDVKGIFRSKIVIKSPRQARRYLKSILPTFERMNKLWIFRTWTIGGTQIGDLMWNEKTYDKVFKNIQSENLVISMKYGVSDFFRNMSINPIFFKKGHKKIIELQAKREYDFFGEMPYYTGFQYEKYYHKLKDNKELIGIMVWCQTGGWHESNRITFLNDSSQITELNTISTLNIFKGKKADDEIIKYFNNSDMVFFLKRYNQLSKQILYPKNNNELYVNKLFIPYILWVYWGNITINTFTSTFVSTFYDPIDIDEQEFAELQNLAFKAEIMESKKIINTLLKLYWIRKMLHGDIDLDQLNGRIFSDKYDNRILKFHIKSNKSTLLTKYLMKILIRKNKKYRLIDRLILNQIMPILIKTYLKLNNKNVPSFVNQQAMPLTKIIS